MHKFYKGILPKSFLGMHELKTQSGNDRVRSDVGNYVIPPSLYGFKFPHIEAAKFWNRIPAELKSIEKEINFKLELKNYLLVKYEVECSKEKCFPCNRGLKKPKSPPLSLSCYI